MTAIAQLLPETTLARLGVVRGPQKPQEASELEEWRQHHREFVRQREAHLAALDARMARIGSRR